MTAVFSPCRTYRYRLDRVLDFFGGPTIGFCLHNPSVADSLKDDPTLRRGLGFARRWGASRLVFINPWAAVATKPSELWSHVDPVGPQNDQFISEAASEVAASGGFVVASWGAVHPPTRLKASVSERLLIVERLIRCHGCDMRALGRNLDGSPKHPLYVKNTTIPVTWQK